LCDWYLADPSVPEKYFSQSVGPTRIYNKTKKGYEKIRVKVSKGEDFKGEGFMVEPLQKKVHFV
jgi:hypothetical protein